MKSYQNKSQDMHIVKCKTSTINASKRNNQIKKNNNFQKNSNTNLNKNKTNKELFNNLNNIIKKQKIIEKVKLSKNIKKYSKSIPLNNLINQERDIYIKEKLCHIFEILNKNYYFRIIQDAFKYWNNLSKSKEQKNGKINTYINYYYWNFDLNSYENSYYSSLNNYHFF